MHFTRGYLFLGLWVLFLLWVRRLDLAERLKAAGRLPAKAIACLCAIVPVVLVVLTLPDNVSFMRDRARIDLPHTFVWSKPTEALLDHLRHVSPPLRILVRGRYMRERICAFTPHRPLLGAPYTTPDHAERGKRVRAFLAEPERDALIDGYGIDAIVLPNRERAAVERLRKTPGWMRVLNNAEWALFRRVE
jgi:hypothetical protein